MTPGDRSQVIHVEFKDKVYSAVVRYLFEEEFEEFEEDEVEHQDSFWPSSFVAIPTDIQFLTHIGVYDPSTSRLITELQPRELGLEIKDKFREKAYNSEVLKYSSPRVQN